ncbi:MAG: transporter substrate-binding domain-containing protein, partial [bacterium]|nr:transporter substrate-binding domain-containing protein [bacterium]
MKRTFLVRGDHNYPPYEFLDKNTPTGFNIELIREIAQVMGMEIQIELGPWYQVREDLLQGRADIVSGMFYSEERDKDFDFSIPHCVVSHALFVRHDSPYATLDDIMDKTIIVQKNDIMHDYMIANHLGSHPILVDDPIDALRTLAEGKYDGSLLSHLQGLYLIHQHSLRTIKAVNSNLLPQNYCFAVKNGDTELLNALNEGLAILNTTGKYKEIYERWFGPYLKPTDILPALLRNTILVTSVLLFIILVLSIWFWSLKRQVFYKTIELHKELAVRRLAEDALQQSEARLRAVIQSSKDGMIAIDSDGRIILFNPAATVIFGYHEHEMMGKTLDMILPQDMIDTHREHVRGYFLEGKPDGAMNRTIELQAIKRDGSAFPIDLSLSDGSFGKERFVLAVIRDIRERIQAEQALRESEQKYRELVEAANSIILRVNRQGIVTFINDYAQAFFAVEAEEILEKPITQTLFRQFEIPEGEGLTLDALLTQPEVFGTIESKIQKRNGEAAWISWAIKSMQEESGAQPEILWVGNNITHLKLVEEQLRHAQKMEAIGQLAGGISHDFNNLLTAILGYCDLAIKKTRGDTPLSKYLDEIKMAGERAAELVQQLLAYSRKQVLRVETIDVNALITSMRTMVGRLIGETIELQMALAPHECWIKADPGQITQVILNLLINARDAMPDGGEITIETQAVQIESSAQPESIPAGSYILLAIHDTGHGMDKETQKRIFDPFFTTKEVNKGTGLGLSTVYGIVTQSGGYVTVES